MSAPAARGLLLLLLVGCVAPTPEPPDGVDPPTPPACPDGPRFVEEGQLRGLDVPIAQHDDALGGHGLVVTADLDDDGDLDLFLGDTEEGYAAFENDGGGQFALRTGVLGSPLPGAPPPVTVTAVDLDGDRLPDLILGGFGTITSMRNLGGFEFGPEVPVHTSLSDDLFFTLQAGDVDGDGDLDLLAPTKVVDDEEAFVAGHRLLLQDAGAFDEAIDLSAPLDSQTSTFGDLDGDGDLDVLLLGDSGPTSVVLRNDGRDGAGALVLVDVTEAWGFDRDIGAMGVDGADLNDDGLVDWCVTDIRAPACWIAQPEGGFVESGAALGLEPATLVGPGGTVGWSLDFADYDLDGRLDVVQASAPEEQGDLAYADLLWWQRPDGTFEDVSDVAGVASEDEHFGLVSADLDGDGALDLVTAGSGTLPLLHRNLCAGGPWTSIRLEGPAGNRQGWGATVRVEQGERSWVRPLLGLRGQGQGPASVHVGLVDDEPLDIEVLWTDGSTSEATDVPVREAVTVAYEDPL